MIHRALTSISYVFHPLIMPFLGVGLFFLKSPTFIPEHIVYAKLLSLFILIFVLPILLFFLLKIIGKANSVHLESTQERIIPLGIYCIILMLVLQRVLPSNQIMELYYFFLGILISSLSCLIMVVLKVKASIHMIAVSGVFMFFIALSIHFSININGVLAFMSIVTGAVATSRLHLKAHNYKEILLGFFIGVTPQLILVNNWLL